MDQERLIVVEKLDPERKKKMLNTVLWGKTFEQERCYPIMALRGLTATINLTFCPTEINISRPVTVLVEGLKAGDMEDLKKGFIYRSAVESDKSCEQERITAPVKGRVKDKSRTRKPT